MEVDVPAEGVVQKEIFYYKRWTFGSSDRNVTYRY
jgi:hypothetical protein